jgi:hypothetical protein
MKPKLPPTDNRSGDETTVLRDMLEYFRVVLVRKTWGLTDEQLAARIEPSEMTLGGLVLHMALVEDDWFTRRFSGLAEPSPWAEVDWHADNDWDFHSAHTLSHAQLIAQFETSVARSDVVYGRAASLDSVCAVKAPDGTDVNLRWIMVHMIEEYARHCGHADLIREFIDGETGD